VFMRWQTFLNEFLPLWAEKNKPVSELVNQVKG